MKNPPILLSGQFSPVKFCDFLEVLSTVIQNNIFEYLGPESPVPPNNEITISTWIGDGNPEVRNQEVRQT